jgi:uncharacterized coiled-coil protein SlyX
MSTIAELIESVSELKFELIQQKETIEKLVEVIKDQELDIRTLYTKVDRLEKSITHIKKTIQ